MPRTPHPLPILLLICTLGLGAGCEQTPAQAPNTAVASPVKESPSSAPVATPTVVEKSPSIDDLSGFLLFFEETAGLLSAEGETFTKSSIDPTLRARYMENGSDVPLMRFLAKSGLNSIESNNLRERIAILKKGPVSSDFGGSVDRLDKGLTFLTRFYSNVVTLQSYEEFKMDTADFGAYLDAVRAIGDAIDREYGSFQTRYPNLDYKLTDTLAGLIVRLYTPAEPPASASPASPTFTGQATAEAESSADTSVNDAPDPAPAPQQYCCKVCSTGKACGDSCISRSYTCHKAPGCACDAN